MKVKNKKFQILVWGLCVVLALGLICMVRIDKKRNAERNIQLQQQIQQPEKNYEEMTGQQSEIYDRLFSNLNMPEFVCWSDNSLTGANGDSLTGAFTNTIGDNLFKNLTNTFHTVLEDGEHTAPSVTMVNMGLENEDMRQVLVRAGVNQLYLNEGIYLSPSKDPVKVRFTDDGDVDSYEGGEDLNFADQKSDMFGKVTISGIQGSLQATGDWIDQTHPEYAFVRDQEGDALRVDSGTPVELESASKYKDYIPLFYFENIPDESVDDFVSDLKKLVAKYAGANSSISVNEESETDDEQESAETESYDRPFVVFCRTNEGSILDNALKTEFGNRYIRTDNYSSEMYDISFRSLSQKAYDILDEQGCFTKIKTQIREAIEEVNNL